MGIPGFGNVAFDVIAREALTRLTTYKNSLARTLAHHLDRGKEAQALTRNLSDEST